MRERERERERERVMCNKRDRLHERQPSLNLRLNIRYNTNIYAVLVVKLKQFEEIKGVFRRNKSKNDKNSLSDNPMYMLNNLKYSSRKVIDMLGWLGIKIMCSSGPTCISADCCFSEVAL